MPHLACRDTVARLLGASCLVSLLGVSAGAQTVSVSAQCNIYAAGHASLPSSCVTSIGPGILPVLVSIRAGTPYVEFHDVTGTVLYCFACTPANGPEGNAGSLTLPSLAGISGISASRARFFEGVFLSSAEPTDPAPPALDFTNVDFTQVSPGIAQHFFIGDGLAGAAPGVIQRFNVPAGATRLFLGFSDGFTGCVGAYDDNSGSITATVVPGPCPACCTADFNQDGDLNPDDLGDFITCYFSEPPCSRADFNADTDVNPDDLGDFITTYFAGCP